jgi:phenylpyruvate tautomerase PptA (4-oxalocrotonate tautomerase family)
VPLLSITTSAPPLAPGARAELLARLSALLARELDKPEEYVLVAIGPRPEAMSFGGDATVPACYAELKNVGTLAPARAAELSRILCAALAAGLGVAQERLYIEFTNADGALWGWNGETFA